MTEHTYQYVCSKDSSLPCNTARAPMAKAQEWLHSPSPGLAKWGKQSQGDLEFNYTWLQSLRFPEMENEITAWPHRDLHGQTNVSVMEVLVIRPSDPAQESWLRMQSPRLWRQGRNRFHDILQACRPGSEFVYHILRRIIDAECWGGGRLEREGKIKRQVTALVQAGNI